MKLAICSRVVFSLILATSLPVLAKDHGKGRGHSKGHEIHEADDRDRYVRIDDDEIGRIRGYYQHQAHCPPGLAKKRTGCLPPGQYRKFRRGDYLPVDIDYFPLPDDLLLDLRPAPRGYRYVRVDRNVYLMAEGTRRIIDAIELFSAVR